MRNCVDRTIQIEKLIGVHIVIIQVSPSGARFNLALILQAMAFIQLLRLSIKVREIRFVPDHLAERRIPPFDLRRITVMGCQQRVNGHDVTALFILHESVVANAKPFSDAEPMQHWRGEHANAVGVIDQRSGLRVIQHAPSPQRENPR